MSLCYTCASSVLSNTFPITGFPVSKFTTFHIPVVRKCGIISAEARTLHTLFSFTIVWEGKKNIFELEREDIKVREKLQLVCKRTRVACYGEGDCGLPRPGSRSRSTFWWLCGVGHIIEPLWTSVSRPLQGGSVTTLSLSCLLKTQTGILSHKMSLVLCSFLKAYGFLEFQSPAGKGRAWPSALNLRVWLSSRSDIWKRGHGCHPACSKADTLNKNHRSKRERPSSGTLSGYLCPWEQPEVSTGKDWACPVTLTSSSDIFFSRKVFWVIGILWQSGWPLGTVGIIHALHWFSIRRSETYSRV